jgi:cystathionine beta-lyase/cystathionine gamma-synthase
MAAMRRRSASGMAATHALLTAVCSAGDHVVLPADLYGDTHRLVAKVLSRFGLRYDLVDLGPANAAPADARARRERRGGRRAPARGRRRVGRPLAGVQRHGELPPPGGDRDRAGDAAFTLAESLGAVESLIEVPHAMTHRTVAGSAAEVPPDLVRLSCGVEAPEDLVADLGTALRLAADAPGAQRSAAGHAMR